ncbi:MAG: NAD-dependent epimerase/dehydratase family protein [Acidimicrobiia bacterium]
MLLVGATGLLGRPVAEALDLRGHEVHRASRSIESSPTSFRLDLFDADGTEMILDALEPQVVVQMTGGVASDPVRLAQINVVTTVNLIRAVARSKAPAAIFVSGSAAEYGDPGQTLASEDSPLRPLSPYGWVKLVEIATARELARLHGLDLTVVRPFNPVLPGLPETTALGNFRRQVLDGNGPCRKVVCGRVDIVRDFVTGSFIGEAIAELVDNPPGGIVNVCSGVGIRLEDVMRASGQILEVEIELDEDPELARLPAPSVIIGDPARLFSLIRARPESTPLRLAAELFGRQADDGGWEPGT